MFVAAVGITMAAGCVALMGGTASAAPESSGGSTTANVGVETAISLSGLTPAFTLTGIPGATVTTGDVPGDQTGPVTFVVTTNNFAGYAVTVGSEDATLTPPTPGTGAGQNPDTIPIGNLKVRETGATAFTPVSNLAPDTVTVHSQTVRSAEAGDDLSTDYQVAIPFVNQDTYSATLDYIATTL
ncbi:hypothetical protein [Jatrophihabitans sp.]|uniref:hypothetical protein n=1 Tax=Jatrophihabitans sp. TaxID=1932789 RepID=UPI0030C663D9